MQTIVVTETTAEEKSIPIRFHVWLYHVQEGEEANTTVDSETKEEAAVEEEPKAPRELTAEELEAKVRDCLICSFLSNDENLS